MALQEEDFELAIKVVVVGNGGVGKSSMIQRYCKGKYTKDYKKTIGVDFLERLVAIDGIDDEVRLMLWDTAGQEEFDTITKGYYRGAQACVLAFSTTDRDSFEAVQNWRRKVREECGELTTAIIQNKIDLLEEAVVTPEEAQALAEEMQLPFFRTSVKENFNIEELFEYLAKKYVASRDTAVEETTAQPAAIGVFRAEQKKEKGASNGGAEEASFQVKPSKQRTKKTKKKTGCVIQ